jgi:hypothetical protein
MMQVSLLVCATTYSHYFKKNLIVQDEKIMELCNFALPHRVLPGNNNP